MLDEQGCAADVGPQKDNREYERGRAALVVWGWEINHDSEKPTSISVPLVASVPPFPSHFTVPLELVTVTSLTISF